MKLSLEQQQIVDSAFGCNMKIDARSGSGKSSTILGIAKQYPDKKILLITYNSKLKQETRERVTHMNLHNIEVHTYHSMAVKYFHPSIINDFNMIYALQFRFTPKSHYSFDLIAFDEAQDLTPLYFKFLSYIIKYNPFRPLVSVIGDKYQNIYQFNDADNRYIEFAPTIFKFNSAEWKSFDLSETFRCTEQIANFVNALIGHKRLISRKPGPKVKYVKCNSYHFGESLLRRFIARGYTWGDIFILAPSVKSNSSPVRDLANRLSLSGISIYVPNTDEERIDGDILKNKLVFTTYHQSKGLERPIVLVMGFDASYLLYYGRSESPRALPNTIYVACTRAIEHLIVVHDERFPNLPYVTRDALALCDVYGDNILDTSYIGAGETPTSFSVTTLVRHLSSDTLFNAMKNVKTTEYQKRRKTISIATKITSDTGSEMVAEISGVAIPAYFEFVKLGKMSFHILLGNKIDILRNENNPNIKNLDEIIEIYKENIIDRISETIKDTPTELDDIDVIEDRGDADDGDAPIPGGDTYSEDISKNKESSAGGSSQGSRTDERRRVELVKIAPSTISSEQLLKLANIWNAIKSGYIFKLNQIKSYNWVANEQLEKCSRRISKHVNGKISMEVKRSAHIAGFHICGYIDCISETETEINIWEFKCTQKIEREHILQLAMYAFVYLTSKDKYLIGDVVSLTDEFILNYTQTKINTGDTSRVHAGTITDISTRAESHDIVYSIDYQNKTYHTSGRSIAQIIKSSRPDGLKPVNFYIFNILDGQILKLEYTIEGLAKLAVQLLKAKTEERKKLSDEDFLKNNINTREDVLDRVFITKEIIDD